MISTPTADVEVYSSLIEIVKTAEDFISGVERSINNNSSAMVKKRQDIARENSWSVRVERILQI